MNAEEGEGEPLLLMSGSAGASLSHRSRLPRKDVYSLDAQRASRFLLGRFSEAIEPAHYFNSDEAH